MPASPENPETSEVDAPFAVIAGLDPAIHLLAKMMDPRVKPAGDT
jgi:hypothetical protein